MTAHLRTTARPAILNAFRIFARLSAVGAIPRNMASTSNDPADLSYGDAPYWNHRYTNEAPDATFDWYQPYDELKPLLEKYLSKSARILMVGCGNAVLSEDMADDGFESILNIDISDVVIAKMAQRNRHRPQLQYAVMDARSLDYAANSFGGVIDKGTLDALMCGGNSQENGARLLQECARVLQPGKPFIMITYGDPRTRLCYLQQAALPWAVHTHAIPRPGSEPFKNAEWLLSPCVVDLPGNRLQPMNVHMDVGHLHFIYVCVKNS